MATFIQSKTMNHSPEGYFQGILPSALPKQKRDVSLDYSFEHAYALIERSANRLYARCAAMPEMNEGEAYLKRRLSRLADYIQGYEQDLYVIDLYFNFIEADRKGLSFEKLLIQLEKNRKSFLAALHAKKEQNRLKAVLVQEVYMSEDIVKWKTLVRFFSAIRAAQLFYEQLQKSTGHIYDSSKRLDKMFPAVCVNYIRYSILNLPH